MLRRLALLALVATLPGCNMVVSERPWFSAAQAGASVQQKPGLWVSLEGKDCAFDAAGPIAAWPDCAQLVVITDTEYSGPHWSKDDAPAPRTILRWENVPHLLVSGQPAIDQIAWSDQDGADDAAPQARKAAFLYMAVRPTAFDAAGRITATLRWPVLCGPLQPKGKRAKGAGGMVTTRPFPGLLLDKQVCTAVDEAALRSAAARSEAILPGSGLDLIESHWVRDKP